MIKIAKSKYKENSIDGQCLFCNNKAIDGEDICQECKYGFEEEAIINDLGGICSKCGTYYAECACK
ncbi:hypothetical protein FC831_13800 [Clostridium botulinum]|nr:hypothetical protein [Clostridium botulinum]